MEILIGKAMECDYRIDDPYVSRKHCRIFYQNNLFYIEDLNSTNGTYVDNSIIQPGKKLSIRKGTEILLAGNVKIDWNEILKHFPQSNGTTKLSREEILRRLQQQTTQKEPYDDNQKTGIRNIEQPQQNDYQQFSQNNIPQPPPPPPLQTSPRHAGLGSELTYAMHANKSFVGAAFLTLVLYYLGFYIGGIIANILYLNSAGRTRSIIGFSPPGYGCLVFLIVTHLILPLVLISLLIIAGGGLVNEIFNKNFLSYFF